MDRDRIARIVALVAGLLTLGAGLWAFIGPRSFYDAVATFPPYNRHLIHDIGAFQIGLGATVLLGLRWRDTLLVVLTGYAAGAVVHAVSHIIERQAWEGSEEVGKVWIFGKVGKHELDRNACALDYGLAGQDLRVADNAFVVVSLLFRHPRSLESGSWYERPAHETRRRDDQPGAGAGDRLRLFPCGRQGGKRRHYRLLGLPPPPARH